MFSVELLVGTRVASNLCMDPRDEAPGTQLARETKGRTIAAAAMVLTSLGFIAAAVAGSPVAEATAAPSPPNPWEATMTSTPVLPPEVVVASKPPVPVVELNEPVVLELPAAPEATTGAPSAGPTGLPRTANPQSETSEQPKQTTIPSVAQPVTADSAPSSRGPEPTARPRKPKTHPVKRGPTLNEADTVTVRRAIEKRLSALKRCYEAGLRSDPGLSGKMRVSMVVNPSGRFESVKVTRDSVGSQRVRKCVENRVAGWRVPMLTGTKDVRISIPVKFNR
jgi:TonB family protein